MAGMNFGEIDVEALEMDIRANCQKEASYHTQRALLWGAPSLLLSVATIKLGFDAMAESTAENIGIFTVTALTSLYALRQTHKHETEFADVPNI